MMLAGFYGGPTLRGHGGRIRGGARLLLPVYFVGLDMLPGFLPPDALLAPGTVGPASSSSLTGLTWWGGLAEQRGGGVSPR